MAELICITVTILKYAQKIHDGVKAYPDAPKVIAQLNMKVTVVEGSVTKLKQLPEKMADPIIRDALQLMVEPLQKGLDYMDTMKQRNSMKLVSVPVVLDRRSADGLAAVGPDSSLVDVAERSAQIS